VHFCFNLDTSRCVLDASEYLGLKIVSVCARCDQSQGVVQGGRWSTGGAELVDRRGVLLSLHAGDATTVATITTSRQPTDSKRRNCNAKVKAKQKQKLMSTTMRMLFWGNWGACTYFYNPV